MNSSHASGDPPVGPTPASGATCSLPLARAPRAVCGEVGPMQLSGGTWCWCAPQSPGDRRQGATFTSRPGEEEPVLRLQLLPVPRCW